MRRTLFVGFTWLLLCASGFAQTLGTITGEIKDSTGAVLPGWPQYTGGSMHTNPTLADLGNDGREEVIATSNSAFRRVDVFVFTAPEESRALAYFTGFVAQPPTTVK